MQPRRAKAWVWILAAAALAAVLAGYGLTLPRRLQALLEARALDVLHRPMRLGTVGFSPLSGLRADGIVVLEPDGVRPLFTVESLRVRLRWLALLRHGRLAIAALTVVRPELSLRYTRRGGWNAAPLAGALARLRRTEGPAPRVSVVDGGCRLSVEGHPVIRLRDLDADLRPEGAKYAFTARGTLDDGRERATLAASGSADAAGEAQAAMRLDRLPLAALLASLADLPVAVRARCAGPLEARFHAARGAWSLGARTDLLGLSLSRAGYRIEDDAGLYAGLRSGKPSWSVRLFLRGARLAGPGGRTLATRIGGEAELTAAGISAPNLRLSIMGLPLRLNARMDGYHNPAFALRAGSGPVDLAALPWTALNGLKPAWLSGRARLDLSLRGPARGLLASLAGSLLLDRGALRSPLLPRLVEDVSGLVRLSAAGARWRDLRLRYDGRRYASSGSVADWSSPRLRARLWAPSMHLDIDASLEGPRLRLARLSGYWPSGRVDVSGTVRRSLPEGPRFAVTGLLQTSFQDASAWLPARVTERLRRAGLGDDIQLRGAASGPARAPKDWDLSLHFAAEDLAAFGLRLDLLEAGLSQAARRLDVSSFAAAGYSGAASGSLAWDLSSGTLRESSFVLAGVDLEKLGRIPALRRYPLTGILSLRGALSGRPCDPKSLQGEAELDIQRGRLLRLPLLWKVGDLLFGRRYNDMVFTRAWGRLRLRNGVLSAKDLVLRSDAMIFDVSGSVAMDGRLDLMVQSRFNERLLVPTFDLRRYAARVAGSLSMLAAVHVGGTWSDPEYLVLPRPLGWLNWLKSLLLGL
ncbi:MAG: AsmA-like C-terminal region-containing protein [Elusimicrobia bacterium]|nr:AsmA-like C-terminal region-containing protein [Elusimicrobiota bacterium]